MATIKLPDPEITAMAAAITFGNNGKSYFSPSQVARITNKDKNTIGAELESAGILATPSGEQGKGKRYSALDIARFMHMNRVSPLRGRKGA